MKIVRRIKVNNGRQRIIYKQDDGISFRYLCTTEDGRGNDVDVSADFYISEAELAQLYYEYYNRLIDESFWDGNYTPVRNPIENAGEGDVIMLLNWYQYQKRNLHLKKLNPPPREKELLNDIISFVCHGENLNTSIQTLIDMGFQLKELVHFSFSPNDLFSFAQNIFKEEPVTVSKEENFKNTEIFYLYRDADNYKQPNYVVISGCLTQRQKETIKSCLHMGEYFIPSQVGLPEEKFSECTEADHCWFEIEISDFKDSNKEATISITTETLVENFIKAKGKWKDTPS